MKTEKEILEEIEASENTINIIKGGLILEDGELVWIEKAKKIPKMRAHIKTLKWVLDNS